MSNRRKTTREREQRKNDRSGYCPNGYPHDWQGKAGYGVVCAHCGAKQAPR